MVAYRESGLREYGEADLKVLWGSYLSMSTSVGKSVFHNGQFG